jgi:hypothetical protein
MVVLLLVCTATAVQSATLCVNKSASLDPLECQAWQEFWSATDGPSWTFCKAGFKTNPCGCVWKAQGLDVGVKCSGGNA